MNLYFCLCICLLPFLAAFILFKHFSSITFSTELIASLLALLAVLPITFLQFFVGIFFANIQVTSANSAVFLFLRILLFNGMIEECLKMLIMLLIPRKNLSFEHFFIASLLCGLCFGCFESMIYFLQHLQSANERGADLIYYMIFARIFTSDLIHTLCTGLCGICVWSYISKKGDGISLVIAILSHAVYDFFAGFQSNIRWFSVVVILFLALEVRIHYKKIKTAGNENDTHNTKPTPPDTHI